MGRQFTLRRLSKSGSGSCSLKRIQRERTRKTSHPGPHQARLVRVSVFCEGLLAGCHRLVGMIEPYNSFLLGIERVSNPQAHTRYCIFSRCKSDTGWLFSLLTALVFCDSLREGSVSCVQDERVRQCTFLKCLFCIYNARTLFPEI